MADVAVIATPDDLHVEPAIAFAKKECDILLEKPVARTSEDVTRMMQVDNYPFAFNKRLFFKNPSLSLSIAFSIETKSFKKAHTS
ncbi:MAG: Gfo/Idh/MocA family oxidoreductase [Thermotogaceae bacterium]|nr:Gfo/Idh/MocA family oxidoreductase [Thermotogaceae bacterium]